VTDFLFFLGLLDIREDFDKQQLNERIRKRRMCPKSSVYGLATSSTESQSFSDRLSVIESSSPDPDETGSHPPTSPQESPDSFNGVLEHPGSNFSESPSSTGLESSLFVDSPSQRRLPLAMSQMEDNHRSDCAGTTSQQMSSPSCMANSAGESPFSPLSSSENPSNIENARLDIVSSDFSQHGTSQPHDPSIQPYTGTSDARIPYDPWLNVHATSQLNDPPLAPYADTNDTQIPSDFSQHGTSQPHDPSIQPYTGTSDTRIPYDPWLNVHATSLLNDPPLTSYADTNDTQIPSDNWPNADATFRLNDPSVAPYASTNRTQVSFDSSQQVPSQRAVYQHPARSTLPLCMTAQREHMATQFSTPVQIPLQAT
jgi:hypothetical protein